MTSQDAAANLNPTAKASNAKWWLIGAGGFMSLFYAFYGLYTVQPIGALPEGATAIVWRNSGEPFFNSADALGSRSPIPVHR